MIMSAAVLASIATAQDPNGEACAHQNTYECGVLAGYNDGNQFLFFCEPDNSVFVVELCSCQTCCSVVDGGLGSGGSTNCH
ncbi:hypothetical protein K503DRAFT_770886 [Rhizopogon vinicolor AM-OR11-026]|uniref:Uncharacterized protein n=1 Tax=Rhizopogon vinicolor AM-OR11-026 TaxID=1314800 RepID=A0A1B7MZL5_9AGAM|nr:hypothetical protein K503DRAFT_770886 [Rhizopogon vinicolor AM-OR11-026]